MEESEEQRNVLIEKLHSQVEKQQQDLKKDTLRNIAISVGISLVFMSVFHGLFLTWPALSTVHKNIVHSLSRKSLTPKGGSDT